MIYNNNIWHIQCHIIIYCLIILQEIVKIINEEIKKRPMLLKIFKCMKCSTHFSQDLEYVTLINSTTSGIFFNK